MRITQRAAERNTQVASYDTVDTVDLGGAYGLHMYGWSRNCFNCSTIYRITLSRSNRPHRQLTGSLKQPPYNCNPDTCKRPTKATFRPSDRHGAARKLWKSDFIGMGGCLSGCLGGARDEGRDPILDAQTRQRAAEAAEARQAKFASSAQGKAAAKQASRERTSPQMGRDAHQQRIADIIS